MGAVGEASPLGRVPVSYTHLDVYKRQTHIRNVYRKLGVHSRDELVELLETF